MNAPVYAHPPENVTPPPDSPRRAWWDRLAWVLLPSSCLGCGAALPAAVSPLGLCPPCRGRLQPAAQPPQACASCSRPLDAAEPPPGYVCGGCRLDPPAFDRLLAVWLYAPPLDAVVQGLKFGRLDYLGRHLAAAIAERLEEPLGERLDGDSLVVPVPLHWRRYLGRGYNQAERIARPLARGLGLPLWRGLGRARLTPPQSRLDREARRSNLDGVFRVRRPGRLVGRHVLLVDDVATTGATLDTAAAALKAAGAAAVTAVVAGRTPVSSWD
jgi:ComF family protein